MTMSDERQHGYAQMALRPVYRAVTETLLDLCPLPDGARVVDVGCGSGLVTAIVLRRCRQVGSVIGIDPSEHELAIARQRLVDPKVRFVVGRAQDIRALVGVVDATILSNVLHQIPLAERTHVLAACHQSLNAGGRCALNTPFYKGTVVEGTSNFYLRWMAETNAVLRSHGTAIRRPQRTPVALQQRSPAEHRQMLQQAGFRDARIEEIAFHYGADDWKTLSNYSVFIEGATGLADLDLGAMALRTGIDRTFHALGLTSVPRRFLFAVATK
jgi:ubiquinone/menaquinone biosynthesis C-methylase UbiE